VMAARPSDEHYQARAKKIEAAYARYRPTAIREREEIGRIQAGQIDREAGTKSPDQLAAIFTNLAPSLPWDQPRQRSSDDGGEINKTGEAPDQFAAGAPTVRRETPCHKPEAAGQDRQDSDDRPTRKARDAKSPLYRKSRILFDGNQRTPHLSGLCKETHKGSKRAVQPMVKATAKPGTG